MVIWAGSIHAQPINTTAGTVTNCPGQTVIPINVTNCNGIGAISLVLNFNNAVLAYQGYQNLNGALQGVGLLIINSAGNQVVISWVNTTPANLGNSTLVELKFTGTPGISSLAWNVGTPGSCEYTDVNGTILPSIYTDGTATINQPPLISVQPTDKTALVGQNTNFSVTASGTGLTYQWQLSTNSGGSWADLLNNATYSNVTGSTLYLTNALLTYNGYKYRCRLTGTCTPVIYTNEITLTVINPVTTTLPTASFCPGAIVVPVTVTNFSGIASFSLTFSYNSSFLTYTGYQNLNGALIPGGTFISNASGGKVYMTWSSTVPVTFGNGTIVELLFTASTGTSSLVWDLTNEGNCEYADLNGSLITPVFVNGNETIYGLPAVTVHPVNKTIAKGQNTTFSVSTTGSGLSHRWQISTNGGGLFTDLSNGGYYSNVTTTTLNITGAQLALNGYQYRCRVSGTCTPEVFSNPAILTVLPNVITTCGTVTVCPGLVTVPINVTDFIDVASFSLALNFNPATLTYTGYQNLNTVLNGGSFTANAADGKVYLTWSNTSAATIPTGGILIELKFTGIPGTSTFTWDTQTPGNCEFSDLNGQVIFSTWNGGSATINTPPAITEHPGNKTTYSGGSATFSVTATGTGVGYLWQVSTNGGANWSNLTNTSPYSGAFTSTLTINPASTGMNGYLYHCIVSGTCTPSVTSNSAQLTVTQAAITTTPGTVTSSCTGNINVPVNVINCSNVGSISLTMIFDTTKLTFDGYHSTNAALNGGLLVVNRSLNRIIMSWASTTAANIGNGVLIQFRFKALAGISTTLSWDTQTSGACEYSDPLGSIITSFYNTSTITVAANALIVNAGSDITMQAPSVQLNGSATGGTPPYTWAWTPVTYLSNPAIPNPVASPPVTTTYTLTVNATGCSGYDAMDVINPVPASRTLQNITVGSGQNVCYDAQQTITVAGGGTIFHVLSGGIVNMIAGLKIDYLPGTKVFSGGKMHGYITTTWQYCFTLPPQMIATAIEEEHNVIPDGSMFTVYPNPATGQFTIEIHERGMTGDVYAIVYGPRGELIRSDNMTGESGKVISLAGKPAGIYFVRVVNGTKGVTKKLIKL